MRSQKRRKKRNWPFFLAGFLIVVLGIYGYHTIKYLDHFLPKTTVNGVNIGGKSVNQANEMLNQQMSNEKFTITDNNQEWLSFSRSDLDLSIDFDQDLKEAMQKQNPWLWPLFPKKNITMKSVSENNDKVNDYVEGLKESITALNDGRTETKDATLSKGDTSFVINPEVTGNSLDVEQILTALKKDIHDGKHTLELENFTKKPSITSSDATLKTKLDDMNKLAQQKLIYSINDQKVEVPQNTLMGWLSYDGENITANKDAIREYVTSLGQTYNTSTNPTSFKSTLRGDVSVPAGTYSWTVQTDSEVDEVAKQILTGKGFTRSPITKGSATADSGLVGSTYIEVDLVNQHMWYYKDGAVVLETDVVTGKPSTPTPPGVFYIWNKQSPSILVGEDYRTPVQYWMPVDWNGVGIHDSNWQPAYGGNLHLTAGSHGCVNTPPGICGELYNMVEIGTPVLIF